MYHKIMKLNFVNYYLEVMSLRLSGVLLHVVHVSQESGYGDIADGVPEEEQLHGGGPDLPQRGEEQKQAAEARGLAGVALAHVVGQDALRLVLQHLHGLDVAETCSFYGKKMSICSQ